MKHYFSKYGRLRFFIVVFASGLMGHSVQALFPIEGEPTLRFPASDAISSPIAGAETTLVSAHCSVIQNEYEITFLDDENRAHSPVCRRYRVVEFVRRCAGEDFPIKIIEKNDTIPMQKCRD